MIRIPSQTFSTYRSLMFQILGCTRIPRELVKNRATQTSFLGVLDRLGMRQESLCSK